MNFKKIFGLCLVAVCALFFLASCDLSGGGNGGGGQQGGGEDEEKEMYIELDDYKAYIKKDLNDAVKAIEDQLLDSQKAAVNTKLQAGLAAIDKSASVKEVMSVVEDAKKAIAAQIPVAEGIISYADGNKQVYTEILGVLEAFAIRNNMLGLSLYENGAYVMYNPRVTLGTENYIVGYGFGVLAEGAITADLESETVEAWKRYYHSYESSDPGTLNYLNDQGAQVGDLYAYIGASFYTNFMNATKDGYDWVPELAKADPIAVNPNANGTATTWKFPIRVGAELKYNTNSELASRAQFNGREVAMEDYITPFKLLLTQTNGLFRGSEMAKASTGAIKGASEYYDSTSAENVAAGRAKDFDETVGVKVFEDEGQAYFQVEFADPVTAFNARYYISSSLYMPIPQEFLDLVTVENYLGYNSDKSETPVDNSLSLGSYTLEKWDSQQQIVFKKNPYYVYADSKFSIQGIHLNILTAALTDNEAGFNEFIAGNIDASGIPETKLAEYKDDPRVRTTKGNNVFKLNVNSCDAATWEYLFGENGTNDQNAKADYYEVEPALSNAHFVKAISLSIDRKSFAAAKGYVGTVNYFSSNYMSDPENSVSYNATQAHASAVEGLLENTDGYGYNLELAREYFRVALVELEAQGKYQPGTPENPTVIELEVAWQTEANRTTYHNYIKQYVETAFNDESVSGGKYKLELKFWVGNVWSDVYYGKMIPGKYDLGFGSISGNALDPLDFFTVNSTNPAYNTGFCLNWAIETNALDRILVYKGQRYSFDALLTAGIGTAVISEGQNKDAFDKSFEAADLKINEDGSATATIHVKLALPAVSVFEVEAVALCWYELYNATGDGYNEIEVPASAIQVSEPDAKGNIVITVTVDADTVADFYGDMGFDVYYALTLDGNPSEGYFSVYGEFPRP